MEYIRSRLSLTSYKISFYLLPILPLLLILATLMAIYGLWSHDLYQIFFILRKTFPLITKTMRFISAYADDLLYVIYIGLILYAIASGSRRYRHFCVRLIIGLICVLCMVETTKFVFGMPRPNIRLPSTPFTTVDDFNSFPSGHTAQFVALFLPLVFYYRKNWLAILGAISITIVGLSRLWLGRHYPIDVVAGVLVGSLVLLLIFRRHIHSASRKNGSSF